MGKGLVMQQLYYANEVRTIDELDLGEPIVKDNELKMAVQLAQMGAAEEFHPENYRDEVADRVRSLIQRKIDGEEITAVDNEEPRAQVIDLMEALKASLAGQAPRTAAAAPKAKMPIKAEAKRKPAKPASRKAAAAAKARAR
jgi:DNA end-binding protein Ku